MKAHHFVTATLTTLIHNISNTSAPSSTQLHYVQLAVPAANLETACLHVVSSNFVDRNFFLIVQLIVQCNMINPPCLYSAEHFGVRCTHWSVVSSRFVTQILEIDGLCSYSQISITSCMHMWDIISLDLL
jgi:hypothetical protein